MKHEKAICKGCDTEKWIVNKGHSLCSTCNRKRLDEQGQTLKPKKPLSKMSDSYAKNLKRYEEVRERKRSDQKEGGYYKCFFCNRQFDEQYDHIDCHHVLGRTGKLLYDYRNLFFVHRVCHDDFEHKDTDYLLNRTVWYREFLKRLHGMNSKAWNIEVGRLKKDGKIDSETLIEMIK